MSRRNSIGLMVMVVAMMLLLVPAPPSQARGEGAEVTSDYFREVCGEYERMDISFVVDQSASLKKTDPDKGRILAGERFIRNLGGLPFSVSVNVSGFGDMFEPGEWILLDSDDGVTKAINAFDKVAADDSQQHTDYVLAMQGALDTLSGRSTDKTCRTFVWFTDGQHDLTPPDDKPRPYEENLDDYEAIVGPQDAPLLSVPIVTEEDAAVVGGLLGPLTCQLGGFADQLVDDRIYTRVLLLDEDRTVSQDPSWHVIESMLKGGDACGTHGVIDTGESFSGDSIDEIIWDLSCATELPDTVTGRFTGVDFPLTLNEIAPSVAPGLITKIEVSVFGESGLNLVSSTGVAGELSGNLTSLTEDFTVGSQPPATDWEVSVESGAVTKACTAVTISTPKAIVDVDSELRNGEPGEYGIAISGPFGPLSKSDIELLAIESAPGQRDGLTTRWTLDPVPQELTVVATIDGEGFREVAVGPQRINVLPPVGFPSIKLSESELSGEGRGPFDIPVDLDPGDGDGGKLCLDSSVVSVIDRDGEPVSGTVRFASGDSCVTVLEETSDALTVEFDRSEFVHDTEFEIRFTSHSEDKEFPQSVFVPTTLRPVVNKAIEYFIIAAVMALVLLMFWAVLYVVNRRSVRIPNLHNHRWYRFDASSPETLAKASEKVDVNATKRPTRSNSEFNAGPLQGKRHVPLFRVWRRPSIDLTMGGSEFSASMASRLRTSHNGRIAVTRGLIEEGTIVAIADGGDGSTGIMLTQSPPAGANAETEFTRQLTDGIQSIQRN